MGLQVVELVIDKEVLRKVKTENVSMLPTFLTMQ